MTRLIKLVVVAAAVFVAAAPTQASAMSVAVSRPAGCNTRAAAEASHTTASAVHLRAGRGTGYRSVAVLPMNTDFYVECWGFVHGAWWAYGEVTSGPLAGFPRGRMGWVAGDHLAPGFKHR